MRKYLIPLVVMLPLALAACGSERPDGFDNEEQKERIWSAYRCDSYGGVDATFERSDILMSILHDDIPMDEVPEAKRWERRLERADTVSDAMEYKDVEGISDMCSGWLWDRYAESTHYSMGYEDFTLDKAREAGIVGE